MILDQSQKLKQKLNLHQMQSLTLLRMNSLELTEYIQSMALENPIIELDSIHSNPECSFDDAFSQQIHYLAEHDTPYFCARTQQGPEAFDALSFASTDGGLAETLTSHLLHQLPKTLSDKDRAWMTYLIYCLDETGYLTLSNEEICTFSGVTDEYLAWSLALLQSFEPAGVGARNPSDCLQLQLLRMNYQGPAIEIVRSYLELLAQHRYDRIAKQMKISVENVLRAKAVIEQLNPYPGSEFNGLSNVQYILPDVLIRQEGEGFIACMIEESFPDFTYNRYYMNLLEKETKSEVRNYLLECLQKARTLKNAVTLRKNTLLKCAQIIADHQRDFFRTGDTSLLNPLSMNDISAALDLHLSTVSRTMRMKYIQCVHGTFRMSYFLSNTVGKNSEDFVSAAAAHTLLVQLIDAEDKRHPLSDQALSELMAQHHCTISRRAVAKYRDKMRIPPASARKQK